jgi:3-oxoacyl-[acyl-carrier-protein] synthase-3
MGTVIERIALTSGRWRTRHSALRLAVSAAQRCLRDGQHDARDVDLLINAGVYRDRNLGEPALAALIQHDIGANPERPHLGGHGTFSFDISNGACGILTALQIADGFLTSRTIDTALIVAGDADPGHGMSENFPFAPAAAAVLCRRGDEHSGLGRVHYHSQHDTRESFVATVGLVDRKNVLRFSVTDKCDSDFADAAARAAVACLSSEDVVVDDLDAVIAAPARDGYRIALADRLGVRPDRILVAADPDMHTAALAAAFNGAAGSIRPGGRIMLLTAGAGTTAGAALYRVPAAQIA